MRPGRDFGHFGTRPGELRFPRDAAWHPSGDYILVADTYNHRIEALEPEEGRHLFSLGDAGLFHSPVSVAIDPEERIFVADAGYRRLVAWLGPDTPKPFDLYVRDFVGDEGTEPSAGLDDFVLPSPDLLVTHSSGLEIERLQPDRLTDITFQQPRFERNNYVYVAVHNRGPKLAGPAQVRFYWADPATALRFPEEWSSDGFYRSYTSEASNVPASWLDVPPLWPGLGRVLGPLVFRPPDPETAVAGDGRFHLLARIVNLHDSSRDASGLEGILASNNVARRGINVTRGPFPSGRQKTLVVRVRFPDIPGEVDPGRVAHRVRAAGAWLNEVSYSQVDVTPIFRGPVWLRRGRGYYHSPERKALVDMTTEVLERLLRTEPEVLDGPNPEDPDDDVSRIVLVVNDPQFRLDRATTGPWPYVIDGSVRYLSVSIHGPGSSIAQYSHGLSHQLGLWDLLEHENAEFARPYADGWDNMAEPMSGAHPLVWSKERAGWARGMGGEILFIPRPGADDPPIADRAVNLNYQSNADSGDAVAVAVGLTEGATTYESEHHFIWIEARSNDLDNADAAVPMDGVLVYDSDDRIPQGLGPVIIRDHEPGTPNSLEDAAVPVGGQEAPPGKGLRVRVRRALARQAGYLVKIDYDPPADDYDVWVARGDPSYMSPDIWVDNQQDGYDEEEGREPSPANGQDPIAGEENRIYAKVHNTGPADAFDVEVAFSLSSPWHTVDGTTAFDHFATAEPIERIPAGESRLAFVTWEPPPTEEGPHHCVLVEVRRLDDDTNQANNVAQRNLDVVESTTASPYTEARFNFTVANDEAKPKLVYLTAEGIPDDWVWSFDEPKILIPPGETLNGTLRLTPPEDAPACTTKEVQVSAWRTRGDTLVRLGGTQVNVDLRRSQKLKMRGEVQSCIEIMGDRQMTGITRASASVPSWFGFTQGVLPPWIRSREMCSVMRTEACTDPPQPNTEIVVRYRDEAGNPVYHTVTTDEHGCFEDFYVTSTGGDWTVDATFGGNQCFGTATAQLKLEVPLPRTEDQDVDGIPDRDEVQGDADGDGIPNHLDPDSGGCGGHRRQVSILSVRGAVVKPSPAHGVTTSFLICSSARASETRFPAEDRPRNRAAGTSSCSRGL